MSDELHQDAVEGGNYDVIRGRLDGLGSRLQTATDTLNHRRQSTFGSTELAIAGNARVRTENHAVPCDMVQVGGALLFGWHVSLGLKRTLTPADVFTLYRFEREDGALVLHAADEARRAAFFDHPTFQREFDELFQYYASARLVQLRLTESKLLAVFQTGATARDVKVLRWAIDPSGSVTYIDSRGERDHTFPPQHDFAWVRTQRADHVLGRHPHVNVLDTVFVETVGGDLTVKVEDNTEDGEGIYAEPVDDPNQSLDDAEISYAQVGSLILLSIRPFQETVTRYLVFDANARRVTRIDAIGSSCLRLPEDHGIVFPGGYYLRTGECKVFADAADTADFEYERSIKAPNGEDVLVVFHRREDGHYALYPYNLIRKEVATPISAQGHSLFADGTLAVVRASDEPGRVHTLQLWTTPFVSPELHAQAPSDGTLLSRIGNRDLVRGISDAYTLCRLVANQEPSRGIYEELVRTCQRFVDAYYWVHEEEVGDLRSIADDIRRTAELIIDEFEKVQELRARAVTVVRDVQSAHDQLLTDVRPEYFKEVGEFLGAMTRLRAHRGRLITLRDTRYVDLEALDGLEQATADQFDQVSRATVDFLLGDAAFTPLTRQLDTVLAKVEDVDKATELTSLTEQLDEVAAGVTLLGEVVAGLDVEDPTQKTGILDGISEVVGHANRVRAVLDARRRSLQTAEGKAEFAAQFRLFGQTVSSAMALATTPETCDDQLSRILLQLEELEARFSELDDFLPQLAEKREEVYDAFTSRKQTLLDQRQRRVGQLVAAADRIVAGITRRASRFESEDDLNSWFAADPMVLKLRQLADQLTELGDTVKSDELHGRLLSVRQDALRGLRDKLDLFDGDSNLIRFGTHRFTVNEQPLELALVPWGEDDLALHLNGTDFTQPLRDPDFEETRPYWSQTVISEDAQTYRGEYLAASMLLEGAANASPDVSIEAVRAYAADRYEEGYERGIHDHDAALILQSLVTLQRTAGLLCHGAGARCLAALFWAFGTDGLREAAAWRAEATALVRLRAALGPSRRIEALTSELSDAMQAFHSAHAFLAHTKWQTHLPDAGAFLFEVLGRDDLRFPMRRESVTLSEAMFAHLETQGTRRPFERALQPLSDDPARQLAVVRAAMATHAGNTEIGQDVALEAATHWAVHARLDIDVAASTGRATVEGLLGQHRRIRDGALELSLDTFLPRLRHFREARVPGFRAYRERRHELLERARRRLRVEEYTPKVMTSFVRNRLVDEVYLPMVGDNLAKQMGAAGDQARTDRMGLLLLISPPGYGKTTLMEYVASRLGLTFVKVNGPALGHDVRSLDPAEAPNATARQEVDKVNLALEMANNVMLYLDDIQHCSAEFLQKFISLCDAQRRIEGVWDGRTRTYDLRGKKFCVVMAGNPYTESGDRFEIPDMLANRADTHNLGDILTGREAQFALSFVENALTSNPVLAPLATRSMSDVYLLVRKAQGEPIATSDLSHDYSAVELNEIDAILTLLFRCRDVLLLVNAEYIRSAAMEEAFRTEPRFQLQGSYRNMAKLAQKLVPAMNDEEVEALISDHYASEAQTLTTGAEANLLKLAELRGTLTPEQAERWQAIKAEFARQKMVGGAEDDPATRITGVLSGMLDALRSLDGASLPSPTVHVTPEVTAPAIEVSAPTVQLDLSPLVTEIRAVREAVGQSNGHGPITREVLVRQVLSVIELLTVEMVDAARGRIPDEAHDAFVEDLKRQVAAAVSSLADG